MVWVQTPITWKGAAVCTLIDVFFLNILIQNSLTKQWV